MAAQGFRLSSPAINEEGKLGIKFTNEGEIAHKEVSPPLEWYNVPQGTKSLALVVEDLDGGEPDGPKATNVHWLVINIPPTVKGLPLGFSGKEMGGDYAGVKEEIKWIGLEMVAHGHRFQFKIIALDDNMNLHLGNLVNKENLLEKSQGRVLGEAVLTTISELVPQDKENGSPFTCHILW